MRLKYFTAPTTADAIQLVRDELGEDAVIVATERDGDNVRVVAAVDRDAEPPHVAARTVARPAPAASAAKPKAASDGSDTVSRVLAYHAVTDDVLTALGQGPIRPNLAETLAERMDGAFRFGGITMRRNNVPLLLAGPPGAGKTLAAAKLAARFVLAGRKVRLITTDTSAGAVEQLTAFATPLKLELLVADGASRLAGLMADKTAPDANVIIDTRGVNPFDGEEIAGLGAQITASHAEAVLVLPAGGDPRDMSDMADSFAEIGCARLIVTRMDIARRLGGVLAAGLGGKLILAESGSSPIVAHGLQTLDALALARHLVADGRSITLES